MLQHRKVISVELTQAFLDRISAHDKTLNIFITVTAEQALAQAKAADARIQRGESGGLTGIPLAHKDIFCTLDVKTSCGSRMLDNSSGGPCCGLGAGIITRSSPRRRLR